MVPNSYSQIVPNFSLSTLDLSQIKTMYTIWFTVELYRFFQHRTQDTMVYHEFGTTLLAQQTPYSLAGGCYSVEYTIKMRNRGKTEEKMRKRWIDG